MPKSAAGPLASPSSSRRALHLPEGRGPSDHNPPLKGHFHDKEAQSKHVQEVLVKGLKMFVLLESSTRGKGLLNGSDE